MKTMQWSWLPIAAFLALGEPAWAVTPPAGSGGMQPSAAGIVSRGGTVTAIGAEGETIAVDGVTYRFSSRYTTVHGEPDAKLRAGAPVRFDTVKDGSSGPERIIELWITRGGSARLAR